MRPKGWFIVAGVLGVVALIATITIVTTDRGARSFVESTYTKASAEGDSPTVSAYRSDSPPSVVAKEIIADTTPVNQSADGSGVYLRYPEEVIAILPRDGGSLIQVDTVERSYNQYHSHIGGFFWGWTSPRGEDFRGGGPGSGK